MDNLPQKLPPVENIRDVDTARAILRVMLERLISMEIENIELKRRLENLTTDTDIKNLRWEIGYLTQWVEHAKVVRNMPRTPAKRQAVAAAGRVNVPRPEAVTHECVEVAAPGQKKRSSVLSQGNDTRPLAWAMRFTLIVLALIGLLFGFAALRTPSVLQSFKDLVPRKAVVQTELHKIPDKAAPAVVVSTSAVPEKRKEPAIPPHPPARLVGLTYYNNRWLSVDWMDGRLFELDPVAGLKFIQSFPNSLTTGLSAGNDCLWSTDSFNRRCYKHDPKTFAVLTSFPTPGPSPSAVYWDGASLWLADKKNRRVYKYLNIGEGAALIHYQLLEEEPVGLWRTNDFLWVLDRARKRIRRYRIAKELIPVDTLDISKWLPGKAQPVGLALTGTELWLLTETPASVIKQELGKLIWAKNPVAEHVQAPKRQAGDGSYVVRNGDTLSSLARDFYGDQKMWLVIRDANPALDEQGQLRTGAVIVIPKKPEPEPLAEAPALAPRPETKEAEKIVLSTAPAP